MESKRPCQGELAGPEPSFGTDDFGPNKNSAKSQSAKLSRSARWKQANPLACWAHAATHAALRRGLISRQPCQACGAEPTDAHHEDYHAPLQIVWLCSSCHKAVHRQRNCHGR